MSPAAQIHRLTQDDVDVEDGKVTVEACPWIVFGDRSDAVRCSRKGRNKAISCSPGGRQKPRQSDNTRRVSAVRLRSSVSPRHAT